MKMNKTLLKSDYNDSVIERKFLNKGKIMIQRGEPYALPYYLMIKKKKKLNKRDSDQITQF